MLISKKKKENTEAPSVAYFDPKKDTYITTDACTTGLGADLWQNEGETFRPVAFARRFLTDCETKRRKRIRIIGRFIGT